MSLRAACFAPSEKITSNTIAFMIAPRINATSRMAHATTSFELLVTEDKDQAELLSHKIEDLNNERRRTVDQILKEIDARLKQDKINEDLPDIIFEGSESWPPGVVGLVSGRLTDKYGRPSFVYGGAPEHFKGSCRGINGFHVVEAMRYCDSKLNKLFLEFGGHPMAGGFAINKDKISNFRDCLAEFGRLHLKDEQLKSVLCIDTEIAPEHINWELFDWLIKFEPYGQGNQKPVFLLKEATIASLRAVGKKEDHLKIKLKTSLPDGSLKFFDCIGFGLSHKMEHCSAGDQVDVVFELEANEWNGTRELQLKLKDIQWTS